MKLCCYDVSVFKSNNETVNPDLERINGEAPTVDLNNHVTGVGFTLEFKQSTWRHKYFGDLRDGKAHGRGELFSSDGATTVEFIGTFYKGRWWKGKVTYSNPDHDTNVTMDVENGVFNGGEGTYKVVNISGFASYDGELSGREKPKPNGMGELKVFNDGNLVYHYEGQFRNGVEDGEGEFKVFKNGSLLYHYKGQFKGGLSYNHMIAWNGGAYTGSLRRGKKWSGKTVLDNGSIRLYKEGERVKVKVTEATAASEFFSFMHASYVVFIYTLHLRLAYRKSRGSPARQIFLLNKIAFFFNFLAGQTSPGFSVRLSYLRIAFTLMIVTIHRR